MRVAKLKSADTFKTSNNPALGIQNYGEGNDFPQKVMQLVAASGTGSSCLEIYIKFIIGRGFSDVALYDLIVNRNRMTMDAVLREAGSDLGRFNGFAIHVNYNMNFKISSISHVPFEHCRFQKMDKETRRFDKIAVHPDWTGQYADVIPFRKKDIHFIDIFNPDPAEIQRQVDEAGGWDNYKGQIFYYSGDGYLVYPTPKYAAVLTDMRTEEGLANVTGRNVCSNFLMAGMIVEHYTREQDDQQLTALQQQILDFQGDDKAGNLLCVQVDNIEEKPDFVPFSGQNYDKAFTATQSAVPDNIGRAFMQPPILRAKDVGANFGADLMKNAYNLYNSITSDERLVLEEAFTEIFKYWWEALGDISFSIQSLSYNAGDTLLDRLGKENADKIVATAVDGTIPTEQKKAVFKLVYGLSEEEINELLGNDNQQQ